MKLYDNVDIIVIFLTGCMVNDRWYGGIMTLRECERLLSRPRLVEGTFLIRKIDKGQTHNIIK